LFTRTPGASAVFRESYVTYSNEAKSRVLGVAPELLERHGAVSQAVAEAMAAGALARSGASLALAVTGVAGPEGGSLEKPVGLVWFACAFAGGLRTLSVRFPPRDRQEVREFAARRALFLGWSSLQVAPRAPAD
jgi:PncC family amidohydrolase